MCFAEQEILCVRVVISERVYAFALYLSSLKSNHSFMNVILSSDLNLVAFLLASAASSVVVIRISLQEIFSLFDVLKITNKFCSKA